GWAALALVVGPVLSGDAVERFRAALLQVIRIALLVIVGVSALWWASRAASFGRGTFSGPMTHSMILAPLAALTGVMCFAEALGGGSWRWYIMFAIALGVTVVCGSRGALGA